MIYLFTAIGLGIILALDHISLDRIFKKLNNAFVRLTGVDYRISLIESKQSKILDKLDVIISNQASLLARNDFQDDHKSIGFINDQLRSNSDDVLINGFD